MNVNELFDACISLEKFDGGMFFEVVFWWKILS